MSWLRKGLAYVGKRLLATVLGLCAWVAIGAALVAGLVFFDQAELDDLPLWVIILFGLPIAFLPWFFLEAFIISLFTADRKSPDE